VFYMGLAHLEEIAGRLIEAGLPHATPAAAIADGTTPEQRVVRGSLATLERAVRMAALASPVLLVIGPVVDLLVDPQLARLGAGRRMVAVMEQVGHA
jgi:siroheme synthase